MVQMVLVVRVGHPSLVVVLLVEIAVQEMLGVIMVQVVQGLVETQHQLMEGVMDRQVLLW